MESIRVSNTEKSDAGTFPEEHRDDAGGYDIPKGDDVLREWRLDAASVREATSVSGNLFRNDQMLRFFRKRGKDPVNELPCRAVIIAQMC